jgi:hypothetical protein
VIGDASTDREARPGLSPSTANDYRLQKSATRALREQRQDVQDIRAGQWEDHDMLGALITRAGSTVLTGLVGAVAYDGAKKAVHGGAVREGAVTALALGLRGRRRLETGAEQVRLVTGDLVAEARARVGEQAPPPGASDTLHDHAH